MRTRLSQENQLVSTSPSATISPRAGLTLAEREEVQALRALCNAHDQLDLKIEVEIDRLPDERDVAPRQFLARDADGALVGFCSLDLGGDFEICGMVHPAQRRRGIGAALLDAALAECRRRGDSRVLLICEDASAAGQSFVSSRGAARAFAEYRMELDASASRLPSEISEDADLRVARADGGDLEDLVAVQSAAFHDDPTDVRTTVAAGLAEGSARYYIARLGDTPVGSLKVYLPAGRAGVYAFGVVPQHRRRGFGRQILLRVIALLAAEGHGHIWLEVDADNIPAIALYEAAGFTGTTTYSYYALSL
jgi:ribosomal protein S18 acetylase RimI-like enzyme